MARYESFSFTREKLRNIRSRTVDVEVERKKDLKKIKTNFRSKNSFKIPNIITVVDGLQIENQAQRYQFELINLPNIGINFINPQPIFYIGDGFSLENEVSSFFDAFNDGTLQEGDISIIRWRSHQWFTKKSEKTWVFNLDTNFNVRMATGVSEIGFGSTEVPLFLDLKLYIMNEKIYNAIQ